MVCVKAFGGGLKIFINKIKRKVEKNNHNFGKAHILIFILFSINRIKIASGILKQCLKKKKEFQSVDRTTIKKENAFSLSEVLLNK